MATAPFSGSECGPGGSQKDLRDRIIGGRRRRIHGAASLIEGEIDSILDSEITLQRGPFVQLHLSARKTSTYKRTVSACLRERPATSRFTDIWQDAAGFREIRKKSGRGTSRFCSSCGHVGSCSRCPGLAYMEGSMYGPSSADCEEVVRCEPGFLQQVYAPEPWCGQRPPGSDQYAMSWPYYGAYARSTVNDENPAARAAVACASTRRAENSRWNSLAVQAGFEPTTLRLTAR